MVSFEVLKNRISAGSFRMGEGTPTRWSSGTALSLWPRYHLLFYFSSRPWVCCGWLNRVFRIPQRHQERGLSCCPRSSSFPTVRFFPPAIGLNSFLRTLCITCSELLLICTSIFLLTKQKARDEFNLRALYSLWRGTSHEPTCVLTQFSSQSSNVEWLIQ